MNLQNRTNDPCPRRRGSPSVVPVDDFDTEHFRGFLREEMRRRSMSQRMLAERSGVDHSTISRLLSSARTPSMATMARLASALDASLPAFLRPRTSLGIRLDARIRAALLEVGVAPSDIDELIAHYRRRQMRDRRAG